MTEKSLMGHRLGKHHLRPVYQDEEGLGGPSSPPSRGHVKASESPISDLTAEIPHIRDAVSLARWKERLRQQDPQLFRVFFPSEPETPGAANSTARLVDVEVVRALRSLENETQHPKVAAEGPYEEVTEYVDKNGNLAAPDRAFTMRTTKRPVALASGESADVRELKEKVESLTQKLEDERFASLKNSMENSITSLRNEIKNNESELKTLITSATDLAKSWISSPGPAAQIAAAKLGFKAVVVEDFPPAAPEEARDGVVEGLKKHGYVARVVEKESVS